MLMSAKISDLKGDRFGRLVVLRPAGRRRGYVLWECRCDCENICYADTSQLKRGKKNSCGCIRAEIMSRTGEQRKAERKTTRGRPAVEHSTRESANKNSKSGIRGVSWASAKQLWKVQIMYNRKPYHLGYFEEKDKDKAIDLRKKAEGIVKLDQPIEEIENLLANI